MKNLYARIALVLSSAFFFTYACADSIQPIVNTKQVLYGSAQKTITSNSDVTIDTQTHQLGAQAGLKTNAVTFNDGTVITSSSTLGGQTTWGQIGGTLSNQADLQSQLTAIGVSTAALSASTTTLGSQVSTLQGQTAALSFSTSSLQNQVNTLSVSTQSIQTNVDALSGIVGDVIVSTGQLQSQINALGGPVSLSTGVTGILQPSHMVSTAAFTTASQTFSGANIFTSPSGNTFTYGISAGSITLPNLSASRFVITNGSSQLATQDLFNTTNTWTGNQAFTSASSTTFTNGIKVGGLAFTNIANSWVAVDNTGTLISTVAFVTAGNISGVIAVANGGNGTATPALVAGTNVTITGSWPAETINASGGSSSSLGVYSQGVSVSTPTSALNTNASLKVILQGSSTAQFQADPSSVTLQGNGFNGGGQLVQLSGGSQLPAVNGNLLTNINGAQITGTIPGTSLTNAIVNQGTLQSGATFYVSSGTVQNLNTNTLEFSDGSMQTTAANAGVTGLVAGAGITLSASTGNILVSAPGASTSTIILNQNTLQSGATFYVSSGTAVNLTAGATFFLGTDSTHAGTMYRGGERFISSQGSTGATTDNLFIGGGSGNFTFISSAATQNLGVGQNVLGALTVGQSNTCFGSGACANIGSGGFNTALGQSALSNGSQPFYSVAIGNGALGDATSGSQQNICIGYACGQSINTGSDNTVIGTGAIVAMTTGMNNVVLGNGALTAVITGSDNTALGTDADANDTGSENVIIGSQAGPDATLKLQNAIAIGYNTVNDSSNTTIIGNVNTTTATIYGAQKVVAPTSVPYEITASTVGATGPYNFTVSTNGVVSPKGGLQFSDGTSQNTAASSTTLVQTVFCTNAVSSATAASSFVPTNISCSITPKSSSDRIFVMSTFFTSVASSLTSGQGVYTLFRGSTNLGGSFGLGIFTNDVASGSSQFTQTLDYVDSPSTTSSTSYSVRMFGGAGATVTVSDGNIPSTMILQEVR